MKQQDAWVDQSKAPSLAARASRASSGPRRTRAKTRPADAATARMGRPPKVL